MTSFFMTEHWLSQL